ncbi:MAG: hypothetical protein K0R40_1075, partial [Burkholderiales bacterium]|nr:hypothetical protein [Burkholderiales bacterium]
MRILAALVAALLFGHAQAQALSYRLEIDAPRELAETLKKGLALARWQEGKASDPQMNAERLRRLADDAVREAREVAATEGYFSAQVSVLI